MTMPNFIVFGAARSGTEALCDFLDQHPDVFVAPSKEPNFFIAEGRGTIPYHGPGDRETLQALDMWVTTRERYEALFAAADGAVAIGEGSSWYLYDEHAAGRIHDQIPDVRLIAILRNPVERAYVAFTTLLREGRETTSDFTRALALEDGRVRAGWGPMWHYRRMGFYHLQLSRYLSIFGSEHMRVVLKEDFSLRPNEIVRDLYAFLGVDHRFRPHASARLNVSMVPAHARYHRLMVGQSALKTVGKALLPAGVRERVRQTLPQSRMVKPEPMPAEGRAALIDAFRADVLALQRLLHRDLGRWLR